MFWCAVFRFGSTHSFPDRQEQRAAGTSLYWVCLNSQLSVSLLMASGDESGAAEVWVLKNIIIIIIIIKTLSQLCQASLKP